ncbi:BQ5605_C004g02743 [Microbotryum silenes-dioicae]|uniref:BQ5605_C004g02743 protein n=1 Tax=Microbotryum silenes-dioicae TaxID=796604 RepID=A0A2X0M8P1_9BASI|nr:BQ5605_C004g02743 [Microbotryum silenes-dioicae]
MSADFEAPAQGDDATRRSTLNETSPRIQQDASTLSGKLSDLSIQQHASSKTTVEETAQEPSQSLQLSEATVRPLPPLPASVDPPATPLKNESGLNSPFPPPASPSSTIALTSTDSTEARSLSVDRDASAPKQISPPPPPMVTARKPIAKLPPPPPMSAAKLYSVPPPPPASSNPALLRSPAPGLGAGAPPPLRAASSATGSSPLAPQPPGGARSYAVIGPDQGWNDAPELDGVAPRTAAAARNTALRMRASRRVYPGSGASISLPPAAVSPAIPSPAVFGAVGGAAPSAYETPAPAPTSLLDYGISTASVKTSSAALPQLSPPLPASGPALEQQQQQSREQALFSVKALYEYSSGVVGDLSFGAGDVLQVTAVEESGWWKGRSALLILSSFTETQLLEELVKRQAVSSFQSTSASTTTSSIGPVRPASTTTTKTTSTVANPYARPSTTSSSTDRPTFEDIIRFIPDPSTTSTPTPKKGKWVCRQCEGKELAPGKTRRMGEWAGSKASPSGILTKACEHWDKYHALVD